MFKKYKAFLRNEGQFEQPGARALQDFVNLYDQQRERSRMDQAVWAAEKRVKEAEEKARVAEERVERLSVEASTTASLSSSRPSADTVTRERFFPEALVPPPSTPLPDRPEPQPGPKCAICANYCYVCPNPWQRTRSKIMASRLAEQRPKLMIPYGIALHPCSHVFCGACLAQSIYHSLNLAFDPELYGMKLPSYILDLPDLESPEFPISCPRCRLKMRPGARKLEINDATASLVLGDTNLEEWNHARFLASRRLIWCPYRGCSHSFDADDVLESVPNTETCTQCPQCHGLVCKKCKLAWHKNTSCCYPIPAAPISQTRPRTKSLNVNTSPYRDVDAEKTQKQELLMKQRRRVVYKPQIPGSPQSPYSLRTSSSMQSVRSPYSPQSALSPSSPFTTPETSPSSADRPLRSPWEENPHFGVNHRHAE